LHLNTFQFEFHLNRIPTGACPNHVTIYVEDAVLGGARLTADSAALGRWDAIFSPGWTTAASCCAGLANWAGIAAGSAVARIRPEVHAALIALRFLRWTGTFAGGWIYVLAIRAHERRADASPICACLSVSASRIEATNPTVATVARDIYAFAEAL
jgi:hypothetical protein